MATFRFRASSTAHAIFGIASDTGACPLRAPAGNPQIPSISAAISAERPCAATSSCLFAHAAEAKQTAEQASVERVLIPHFIAHRRNDRNGSKADIWFDNRRDLTRRSCYVRVACGAISQTSTQRSLGFHLATAQHRPLPTVRISPKERPPRQLTAIRKRAISEGSQDRTIHLPY